MFDLRATAKRYKRFFEQDDKILILIKTSL